MSQQSDPAIAKAIASFAEEQRAGLLTPAPEYKTFVEGEYVCEFDHERSGAFKADSGNVGITLAFQIVEGDYQGRVLREDRWFKSQDPEARRMTLRDLQVVGLDPQDSESLLKPPAIAGRFIIKLQVRKNLATGMFNTSFEWIRRQSN